MKTFKYTEKELAEEIRQVLLGGNPQMDRDGVPFSGLASVIAETLWEGGYRDSGVLLEKLHGQSERIKVEMTVADDYQRGCLHGINLAAGIVALERLGIERLDAGTLAAGSDEIIAGERRSADDVH